MTNWILPSTYKIIDPQSSVDRSRNLTNALKFYREDFLPNAHVTYFGENDDGVVECVVSVLETTEHIFEDAVSQYFSVGDINKAIMMTKHDDHLFHVSVPDRKDFARSCKEILKNSNPGNLRNVYQVRNPKVKSDIAALEAMHSRNITQMQIAVLYVTGQEKDMTEVFANQPPPSSPFWEFMNSIADRITLTNWRKFRGDLDADSGENSYFAEWEGREIMFHLAPWMNADQHRRNIGNDIIFIVYYDNLFDPLDTSLFSLGIVPAIFTVVRPSNVPGMYQIGSFLKDTIPEFRPYPPPPNEIFDARFVREFIFTRLHNGLALAKTLPPMCNLFLKPKAAALADLGVKYPPGDLFRKSGVKADDSSNLIVHVLKGNDLVIKDSCGTSDPFVIVTMLSTKFKTKVQYKTLNPVWQDEIFTFPIGGLDTLNEIHFKVMDKDKFGTDYMGEFKVVLNEALANLREPQTYVLVSNSSSKPVSGTITVMFDSE